MFTGLIESIGTIVSVAEIGSGRRFRIESELSASGAALGDSIAIDGVCLTVTALDGRGGSFDADASHETARRTTLGEARARRRVHLERALRLGDRLGGHIVSGHVDAVGKLRERRRQGQAWDLRFTLPPSLAAQVVEKGSVALDGVSLTVNACGPGWLGVTIIPYTGGKTLLLDKPLGSPVNVETDVLGKYVVHVLGMRGDASADAGLGDALRRQGFL